MFFFERAMKNLVIKLNHELTEKYLNIAGKKTKVEMENDKEASGVYLDIQLSLLPGLTILDALLVDGKKINIGVDDLIAVDVSLESVNDR